MTKIKVVSGKLIKSRNHSKTVLELQHVAQVVLQSGNTVALSKLALNPQPELITHPQLNMSAIKEEIWE